MIVQHNLPALNAKGYLNKNVAGVKKSSEKLASGYRINRAGDDASGLAVSEKLRSQLRGINQASRNCQDGINLVQTFEGALGESQTIIQRCKELAAQAANGTYDDLTDREAAELEYKQLCDELDAISDTDFNGICMLNGGKIQAPKDSGMFWASPTSLSWRDGTFVNNTSDPNFNMTISKLPALDEMTLIDETEKKALEEFNGSTIGVKLDDGKPSFYFKAPEPSNVYVTTTGIKGTVYVKGNSGDVTPIAEVHITGVDVKNSSTGRGNWSTMSSYITVSNPKCRSTPSYGILNANSDRDPYNGSSTNEPRRKEFYDWLDSIPKSNTSSFKVTDDRKHFTIVGDASFFKEEDGTPANNTKEYDLGTTLIMTTKSYAASNRSEKDYTWDDAKITVSWNADTIRPGDDLYLSTNADSRSSSGFSTSKSFIESYDDKGYPRWEYLGSSESIGESGGGTACPATSSETFPGAETAGHNFWVEHGSFSFTLTYNAATKRWSASASGSSKTYNEGTTEFKNLVSKFGLSLNTAETNFDTAYNRGYYVLDNSYDETKGKTDPRYRIYTNGRSTFSFSISYSAPSLGNCAYRYWSPNYTNSDLYLGKYNPDNPSPGGIDYESAVEGTYRYVNDDKINTIKPGYWVDGTGKKVNLEDVGIYFPKKYDYDVLPSEKYDSTHFPLHDGLTITVNSEVTGPTGEASATIKLWEGGDSEFIPMIKDNPADYGLTYSSTLDIQANSRSKDIVRFTFVYHADGIGDLICDTNCSAEGLGLSELSLEDQESANYLIDRLDEALNKVSMVRSTFGSIQNRLEKKVTNLAVSNENLSAAESGIRDTDMAREMMNSTKTSLLQQAAQTMLAQTSRLPESMLQLLG